MLDFLNYVFIESTQILMPYMFSFFQAGGNMPLPLEDYIAARLNSFLGK